MAADGVHGRGPGRDRRRRARLARPPRADRPARNAAPRARRPALVAPPLRTGTRDLLPTDEPIEGNAHTSVPGSRRNRDNHRTVRIDAETELLATRPEVWALLAEPQHLADWWPAYASIRPDRRGLAEGARWRGRPRRLDRPAPAARVGGHPRHHRGRASSAGSPGTTFSSASPRSSSSSRAADGMTRATLTIDEPRRARNTRGPAPLPRQAPRPTARPLPDCCHSVDAHVRPPLPRCIARCRLRRARHRHPRRRRHRAGKSTTPSSRL